MYAKIENEQIAQYPYTLEDFAIEYPNVSLPVILTDADLLPFGIVRVVSTAADVTDALTQNAVENDPVYVETRNRWEQTWSVVPASEEEIAEREANAKTYNASRAKAALVESDWCENASVRNPIFTPHLTNGAEFDAYRVALRAIAVNPPTVVTEWPQRPNSEWA